MSFKVWSQRDRKLIIEVGFSYSKFHALLHKLVSNTYVPMPEYSWNMIPDVCEIVIYECE